MTFIDLNIEGDVLRITTTTAKKSRTLADFLEHFPDTSSITITNPLVVNPRELFPNADVRRRSTRDCVELLFSMVYLDEGRIFAKIHYVFPKQDQINMFADITVNLYMYANYFGCDIKECIEKYLFMQVLNCGAPPSMYYSYVSNGDEHEYVLNPCEQAHEAGIPAGATPIEALIVRALGTLLPRKKIES